MVNGEWDGLCEWRVRFLRNDKLSGLDCGVDCMSHEWDSYGMTNCVGWIVELMV